MFSFEYLNDSALLDTEACPGLGGNINGPALIRAPEWLDDPPARYLLYFAHHEGDSIRLACSDDLLGPWHIQQPPPLRLEDSLFATAPPRSQALDPKARAFIEAGADGDYPHIASPDIWVDHERRQIRLYYHGRLENGLQMTRVALSTDGRSFVAREPLITDSYLRLFRHDDWFYGLAMPAKLYRSRDGLADFETGPFLTDAPIRHHALLYLANRWYVFWTRVGDTPERILVSKLITDGGWHHWRMGEPIEVHRAGKTWEGADLPPNASAYGAVHGRANQLRDPAIFVEDDKIYLLYALAGEQGIGIGRLTPA